MVVVVYHPQYVFGSRWFNFLHPFEFDRARQAVRILQRDGLPFTLLRPTEEATLGRLAGVHTPDYLESVRRSKTIARVAEVPFLSWMPEFWLRHWFVRPSLWAVAGTVLAAREALKSGLALQTAGGFHHAKAGGGEGFCLFNDIALTMHELRADGTLKKEDRVYYIDLDAHLGNGVAHYFKEDPLFTILDVFNEDVYPCHDRLARQALDIARPLPMGSRDPRYLEAVDSGLEELFSRDEAVRLVIYNAGNDIYEGDRLGGLRVSESGVLERDRKVLTKVAARGIPTVILASGGYSKVSARLLARLARQGISGDASKGEGGAC